MKNKKRTIAVIAAAEAAYTEEAGKGSGFFAPTSRGSGMNKKRRAHNSGKE